MVWPLMPLVLADKLLTALALSLGGTAVAMFKLGLGPHLAWPMFVGILCAIAVAAQASIVATASAGTATRKEYDQRVTELERQAGTEKPLRMFKATVSNTFRLGQADERAKQQARIDLTGFCHVLEVNAKELWCDIEACATFETAVAEMAKHGFMPLVVPELRHITVGGAVVGIGIESTSFKHGLFHKSLLEADILLASGKVERVAPDALPDLFAALPNSLGSFGYLVRLRIRIQPIKPYVRLTRKSYATSRQLIDELVKACSPDAGHDFVDGVALSDEGGCVLVADFVSELPKGVKTSDYTIDRQFYTTLLEDGVDYLTFLDYIWRWDADWFWCTQIFPFLGRRWMRWILGGKLRRSDMYKKFNDKFMSLISVTGANKDMEHVIQDIIVPQSSMPKFLTQHLKATQSATIGKVKLSRPGSDKVTVPFWLCPVMGDGAPLLPLQDRQLYINVGFWDACEGPITQGGDQTANVNKSLEKVADELGAVKSLYSSVHYDEEELYRRYGGGTYKAVKAKYDPSERLRPLYSRVTKP